MSIIEDRAGFAADNRQLARIVLPLFTATLFVSAFLLFSVQPFFAKMVLPRLGGSPGVWSVAMVFFQSVLLAGYGYAHFLSSRLNLRVAGLVHGLVMVSAFLVLPIALPAGWEQPPEHGQEFWLLGLFGVAVGLPFFAVSANGPLLQSWFSRTGHAHAHDPYFLYAASNIGSFASLLLYIAFFEPFFTVPAQSMQWTVGMMALTVLVMTSAWVTVRLSGAEAGPAFTSHAIAKSERAGWPDIARWVALAFVPSGLLVAVTAHISVDVAAAPFLWVMPLALFLLTFVFAFRREPLIPVAQMERIVPVLAALTAVCIFMPKLLPVWVQLPIHLVTFFFAALYCHTLLVQHRPKAENLTAFYLWMSAGGVAGGIFASLLSPLLFNWVAEYPLLLLAALACRPALWVRPRSALIRSTGFGALVGLGYYAVTRTGLTPVANPHMLNVTLLIMLSFIAAFYARRNVALHAALLAAIVPLALLARQSGNVLMAERTFFGVVRVIENHGGRYRIMAHGGTLHGAMEIRDADGKMLTGRPEPLTYYHKTGGMAQALFAMQKAHGGEIGQGGIVGLGTGSLLCHTKASENWTVYEIDRSVIDAASNPAYFRFISDCAPQTKMVIGDARLTIAHEPAGKFDYLLVDAFSSDSIPVHLMTREALQLYMDKVSQSGVLVVHISNKYVELMSVLASAAEAEGWQVRGSTFAVPPEFAGKPYVSPSIVAVLARTPETLAGLADDPAWDRPQSNGVEAWTDDYSNIVAAMIRFQRQ